MKLLKSLLILILLLVNLLFVTKYGERQHMCPVILLDILYSVIFLGVILLLRKFDYMLDKLSSISKIYWVIYSFVLIFFVFLTYKVDGFSITVDRWAALEIGIKSYFTNIYPYTQFDYLNHNSSHLPALFILGLPFYLLQNVALFQVFGFISFIYATNLLFKKYSERLLILSLMGLSISYVYEIYCKSDFVTNFLLVFSFIVVWKNKFEGEYFKKAFLLGVIVGVLSLTRFTIIIPIALFLANSFFIAQFKVKMKFLAGLFLSIGLICLPIIVSVPNYETFIKFNPITLQAVHLPSLMNIMFLIIPLIFATFYKFKTVKNLSYWTILFYLVPVLVSFSYTTFLNGFHSAFYNSGFDITYFNMFLPFLIYSIVYKENIIEPSR